MPHVANRREVPSVGGCVQHMPPKRKSDVMSLLDSSSHQTIHFVEFLEIAQVVDHRAVQPILDWNVFPLHQCNLLERLLKLVLAEESRHHEVPSSRAESEPPIPEFLKDLLTK